MMAEPSRCGCYLPTTGQQGTPAVISRAASSQLTVVVAGFDGEAQVAEDLDGAGLAALEVTGGQALSRGELVGGAEDRLGRVATFIPDEVVRRRGRETVRGEEGLRAEAVVLLDGAHH